MRQKQRSLIAAVFLMVSFALVLGKTSARFPPVYQDEVVFSVYGYNLLSGQGHRYSLYDDIFDRSVYVIRDALPDITRIIYNTWDGLWLKSFGRTYRHARWSSVAAGVLLLWLIYQIGLALEGPVLGVAACALCAINPVMLFASSVVRPEILLSVSVAFSLWLILRLPTTWAWKPFVIGTVMGLSTAIHWNAIASGAGLFVTYVLMENPAKRMRHSLWMAGGIVTGALVAFRGVDPGKFVLSLHTVNYLVSTPPPLLGDPWHPWRWTLLMLQTVFLGQTSFMNWALVPLWRPAIALSWIALGLCVIGSRSRLWTRALGMGFTVTLVMMLCLIKRQEFTYALTFLPFLFPLAAGLWTHENPSPSRKVYQATAALCLVVSLAFYGMFVSHFVQRTKSFDQVSEELHRLIPDSSLKVAGPNVVWFVWPPENFRDLGAVITSGWYTEGRKDLAGCLAPWKPDILVIDEPFRHVVGAYRPMLSLLQQVLPADVRHIGSIETGSGPTQGWELYRLDWRSDRNVPMAANH